MAVVARDQRQRLANYLFKKYNKTTLSKVEAMRELLRPIKGNKMTIDEVAQQIHEDYGFGIFF